MSGISKEEFGHARDDGRASHNSKFWDDFDKGFENGFKYAVERFGIWKNGVLTIGCLDIPIKEILKGLDIE